MAYISGEWIVMWLSIRYHFSQNPLGLKLAFWGFLLITLLSVPVLSPGMDINMMSTGFLSPTYAGGALVPTFLLALYSGYVEFNSLECARRSAKAECVYTLLWLFSCALLGALLISLEIVICARVFCHQLPTMGYLRFGLLFCLNYFMQLAVTGLVCYMLVSLGVPWGYLLPLMMTIYVVSGTLFGTLLPLVIKLLFYFLSPGISDLEFLLINKTMPAIGLMVLLIVTIIALRQRCDHWE